MDMARYLAGADVTQVSALQRDTVQGHASPANTAALCQLGGGIMGYVSACTEQWMPYVFNIELFGADGAIRGNRFYSRKLPGATGFVEIPTVMPDSGAVAHHPFQEEIDHFVDCIRSGREFARQPGGRRQHPPGLLRRGRIRRQRRRGDCIAPGGPAARRGAEARLMRTVAVIGAGNRGATHLDTISRLTDLYRLVGVCDAREERRAWAQETYGAPVFEHPLTLCWTAPARTWWPSSSPRTPTTC